RPRGTAWARRRGPRRKGARPPHRRWSTHDAGQACPPLRHPGGERDHPARRRGLARRERRRDGAPRASRRYPLPPAHGHCEAAGAARQDAGSGGRREGDPPSGAREGEGGHDPPRRRRPLDASEADDRRPARDLGASEGVRPHLGPGAVRERALGGERRARALRDRRPARGRLLQPAAVHPGGRKIGELPRHRAGPARDREGPGRRRAQPHARDLLHHPRREAGEPREEGRRPGEGILMARAPNRREVLLVAVLGAIALVWVFMSGGEDAPQTVAARRAQEKSQAFPKPPTVHMELLDKSIAKYDAKGRDVFKYAARPPSMAEYRRMKEEAARARKQAEEMEKQR